MLVFVTTSSRILIHLHIMYSFSTITAALKQISCSFHDKRCVETYTPVGTNPSFPRAYANIYANTNDAVMRDDGPRLVTGKSRGHLSAISIPSSRPMYLGT